MVWSCEKGNGGRSAEINGGNGSIGEKGSSETKENLEINSEEGLGTNSSVRELALDRGRSLQVRLLLEGKYGLYR